MLAKMLAGAGGQSQVGIQYVGGSTQTSTGTTSDITVSLTSLTGGSGTAPIAGDFVVVYFGTGSTANRDLVIGSGFTELTELYANSTFDANLVVAYKVMGSTPDTSFTITGGTLATADAGAIAVQVWRNVAQITAFTTATITTSVLCNPPAITPTIAGSVIVSGGAGAHDRGTQTFSSSDLTGFITAGGNSTNDVTIGIGYNVWTSGAFDPAAFTFSSTNNSGFASASVTLVLAPTGSVLPAPTFIASTNNQVSGSSTLTINKPSGTQEGDLMVAVMSRGGTSAQTWTGDTGWTEVADQTTASPSLRIAYKVAGSSEGSSYSFTCSSSVSPLAGCILTYRGAAYDTIGAFATGSSSLSAPSINTSLPNCVLIASFSRNDVSITCTTPTGMTARVTDSNATAPSYLVADEVFTVVGATGVRTSTVGSTTDVAGILMSIKPA